MIVEVGSRVEVLVRRLSIRPRWMAGVVRESSVVGGRPRVVVEVESWLRVAVWVDSPHLRVVLEEGVAA